MQKPKFDFEIKRFLFGLSSILESSHIPSFIVDGMPDIFEQILALCNKSVYL